MIKEMHHTALTVSNMERSLAFYCGLLGMEKTIDARLTGPNTDRILGLEGIDVRRVYVAGYGGRLELFEFKSPQSRPLPADHKVSDVGYTHVGFAVENIKELYEELSAKGIQFVSPPLHIENRGLGCYLQDPDGNMLSFTELYTPGT
jgi:catechol 2,3-dioxygenase-like lactoylglutathione lyase family enzyme